MADSAPDNCLENANPDEADRDADGIGDSCDVLPPGDLPALWACAGGGSGGQR